METLVHLVKLVSKELVGQREQVVTLDRVVLLASLDSKEWWVLPVPRDSWVTLVLLVWLEQLDSLEPKANEVM